MIAGADDLFHDIDPGDPGRTLTALRRRVDGRIVLTTSFGIEDQVLTHIIATRHLDIEIATLDTGRLFPETHDVWARTEERYGLRIRAVHPQAGALEDLVARQGVNGFYASVDNRKACCDVRKVAPLGRLLHGAAAWVTGLRADQSGTRAEVALSAWDGGQGLIKVNPLAQWTRADVAAFAADHDVPVNALHADGFLSIGCAPCTRAVAPGEPERAGRWWWEAEAKKECGLHLTPDGRLAPAAASVSATPAHEVVA
ncbi:phosphoadenylyl-sulfate reductase [Phreatobacter sp. HK31-P]